MMWFIPRWLQFLGLLLLTIGVITACHRSTPSGPIATTLQSSDCYVVKHLAGESCIPNQPSRIIALDTATFEYAIALGMKPIGSVFSEQIWQHLQGEIEGVDNVGSEGEPSLEKILALQPDLILGLDFHRTFYPQISQIAPTVLYELEHSGQWKQAFQRMGEQLNQKQRVERVMHDYYQRLDQFKQQAGDRLSQTEVSVIRIYQDTINLYLKDSFCGTVLQDAGLSRPKAQDISAAEAKARFGNEIQVSISRELFGQADGDVMFVWTGENTIQSDQNAQRKLEQLQSDPLWQTLKVVQQNKIYQVPNYWIGNGPIAANAIIDDLFKYLIGTP